MCSVLGLLPFLKKDSKKQNQLTNAYLAYQPPKQEATTKQEQPTAEEIVKKNEPVVNAPITPVNTTGTGINTTPRVGLNL